MTSRQKGAFAVLFAKSTNKSECLHCHKVMADKHTQSHLLECNASRSLIRSERENRHTAFLIRFYDFSAPKKYFLYAVIPQTKTLQEIDALLREEWLECCGHVSTFEMRDFEEERRRRFERLMSGLRGGEPHESEEEEDEEDDFAQMMNLSLPAALRRERRGPTLREKPLHTVLHVGKKFFYNYDMGSTTRVGAEVLQIVHCESEEISLVARDVMPRILCAFCNTREAKYYVSDDFPTDKVVCNECKLRLPVGYYRLFEIRNSPRMGICGFGLETLRVKKRRREEGEEEDEEEEENYYDDYEADESVEEYESQEEERE